MDQQDITLEKLTALELKNAGRFSVQPPSTFETKSMPYEESKKEFPMKAKPLVSSVFTQSKADDSQQRKNSQKRRVHRRKKKQPKM